LCSLRLSAKVEKPPFVGRVLEFSSFIIAKDIFGRVPPELTVAPVLYSSEVLISVFPGDSGQAENTSAGAESLLLERIRESLVGVLDLSRSLGVALLWMCAGLPDLTLAPIPSFPRGPRAVDDIADEIPS